MTASSNTHVHRISACSTGTIAFARTHSPVHWYTLRSSYNREVTRVKKDVRVNLARCALAEMNSFRPFLSGSPALFLFLSPSLMDSLSTILFSALSVSLLYFHPSSRGSRLLDRSSPPPTGEFLFIYGGLNEP